MLLKKRLIPGLALLAATVGGLQARPNFLVILVDDMGMTDVGFKGSTYYETPNIDKLAAQGRVFDHAYTNSGNCAPSRAAIMSGQYAPRTGIYTVNNSDRGLAKNRKLIPTPNTVDLYPGAVTLAEALKAGGYTTGLFGKWHLGAPGGVSGPAAQGFNKNVGGGANGQPASYFSPYKNPTIKDGPKGEYLTDRLATEVCTFITNNRSKPFFIYMSDYSVHEPLQGKAALVTKYKAKTPSQGQKNATYAAMIESTDKGVAKVLAKLDYYGLTKNTVVVFYSDNGGVGGITNNIGLRGSKGMLYDGGIRVPAVIRWPNHIAPGRTDVPLIATDLYPTFLELAGVTPPANYTLDGRSIAPFLLTGAAPAPRGFYWHYPVYLEAETVDQGMWRSTPSGSIILGDYKLIEFFEYGQLELYNLKLDPMEKVNLAVKEPYKTIELRDSMYAWRAAIHAPVPTELNPLYDPDSIPTNYYTIDDVNAATQPFSGQGMLAQKAAAALKNGMAYHETKLLNGDNGMALEFSMRHAGKVVARVVSMKGEVLEMLVDQSFEAGNHRLDLKLASKSAHSSRKGGAWLELDLAGDKKSFPIN